MHGFTADKEKYLARLRRVEGQVRGLQKMVEDDKYCIDILTQVSAVTSALQSVALGLMCQYLLTPDEVTDAVIRATVEAVAAGVIKPSAA